MSMLNIHNRHELHRLKTPAPPSEYCGNESALSSYFNQKNNGRYVISLADWFFMSSLLAGSKGLGPEGKSFLSLWLRSCCFQSLLSSIISCVNARIATRIRRRPCSGQAR